MIEPVNESKSDALIKIQTNLKAPKSQYNSFGKYNYRSAEDILEAVKPLLAANNCQLTISEDVLEIAGHPVIKSTATFNDGTVAVQSSAFAGVDVNKKGMDYSQSYGSSSSYSKKYALSDLFLLDDTKDADSTNTHGKEKNQRSELEEKYTSLVSFSNNQKAKDTLKDLSKLTDAQLMAGIKALS